MSKDARIRLAAALAMAAAAALVTTTHGAVDADGMWLLQVVARMEAGDALYRDIFAGVPPLAFLVARTATRAFGLELASLRFALVAVLALSYVVSADLLRRVIRSSRYDVVLAGLFLVSALPGIVLLYQPLANLCLLASLDAVASWSGEPERRGVRRTLPLWLAGAAAGLSFLSKQTVGAFALLAAGAAIATACARRQSPLASAAASLATAGAAFALTVAAGLVPVAADGAWEQFLDYGFLNKGTYLNVGGVSYLAAVGAYLDSIRRAAAFDVYVVVKGAPLVLPALLAPALAAVAAMRHRIDIGVSLIVGLGLAEAASLFPRADLVHVVSATPGMLVVGLVAWHIGRSSLSAAWRKTVEAVCIVAVVAGLAVPLGASASALASGARAWSGLPHLKYVLMYKTRAARLERHAGALRAAAPSGALFLLTPEAGLYYLLSGIKNPTPFDYPLVTALGRSGEAELVRSVEDGRLSRVCMRTVDGPMAPARLQQAVLRHLRPAGDLGPCMLYEAPRAAAGGGPAPPGKHD